MSSLIHSCACILFFVSAVRTFTVTIETPTQCDNLAVSWTGKHTHRHALYPCQASAGGEPPFEILLIPVRRPSCPEHIS